MNRRIEISQKGFTFLETMIFVLVVASIGFAGYTVWSNNQKEESAETATTIQENNAEATDKEDQTRTDTDDEVAVETINLTEYTNSEYGFSFSHPSDATVEERKDTPYFQVVAEKNNGNNPALNVFGEGNYKIQVQAYSNGLSLENLIAQGVDGDLMGEITKRNGADFAITSVSSESIQGPGYDIYWFGKDGLVVSLAVYGDSPIGVADLADTVTFN
jgi:Tfp pilus assembly protein PilE